MSESSGEPRRTRSLFHLMANLVGDLETQGLWGRTDNNSSPTSQLQQPLALEIVCTDAWSC